MEGLGQKPGEIGAFSGGKIALKLTINRLAGKESLREEGHIIRTLI